MKNSLPCCLVLMLVVAALTPLALGQESVHVVVPQGRDPVLLPHLRLPPPTHPDHPDHPDHPELRPVVALTGVEAHITISDQIATTTLVLTLTNSSGRPQEAQVLLPVPDGAAVRSFQLDSLGSEPTAKLLPREEARRIYDAIVRQMKDPGLLEFAGYNQIRSSVFPIPARGQETVRLTYEHLLAADGNRVDYVLPRSDAGGAGGKGRVGQRGHGPGGFRDVAKQGAPVWTISADLRSSRRIATVYSASHDVSVERHSAQHVTVRADAGAAARAGAFRLSYLLEPAQGDGIAATLMAYPDAEIGEGKGGYFMLLAALPQTDGEKNDSIKREVTIVIDRSGSMRGEKMEQAREAARQVIEGLEDGEAFNIIDFASDVQMFSPHPVKRDAESIRAARGYINGIRASGGTNIHDALLAALRQAPMEGMLPVVLFLTDGLATVGRTREAAIREAARQGNPHERRIFTFGVGYDVNAPLLSGLARENRAISTFVLPEEDVEVKVSQVFRRLSGPVLASPKLTIIDAEGRETTRLIREMQPAQLPDIFEGDQILILGQYTQEGPVVFRLEGNYRGKARQFEMALSTAEASTRHAHVPRLWASRKIGMLIEEIRAAGADGPMTEPRMKELVDEIVLLSIRYGILTEYTAFLATEPGDAVAGNWGTPMTLAAQAPARAESQLRSTWSDRSGSGGVARQRSLDMQQEASNIGQLNVYVQRDQRMGVLEGVQHIGDRTLFRRGSRWVDARIMREEEAEPEAVVEFGSPAYAELLDRLARDNLQGLLGNLEDTYLLIDGRRVLVRGPS